ncbi:hypothetical protein ACFVR6_03830 [Microbacterium sp. NPDC058021]|uniref:hypothetical protein n=1 Tax=Microbacterium sp. NPDC058021 TaxID=3346306 RepID=UPI0036DF4779
MSDVVNVDSDLLTWPNGELVDVESIEGYAEDARIVATSPLEDGVIRTPDWVMGELANVSRHAARMVLVIHQAEAFKRRAATELERARARARVEHAGMPPAQQTARIVLAVLEEKRAYDDAVVAFEYARRIGNLLSDYTGRVQSIGKQVELVYRDAGRGL